MNILISGASTGIGKAFAVNFANKGNTVWAGVRSQKDFDFLMSLNHATLKPIFLDVTDTNSIHNCLDRISREPIDGVVNNAGIAVGGPVEALSAEEWRKQFNTNFFGAVELTRICLPHLRQAKGRLVNISSISGRYAPPFMAPYAASKFALEAFSDSLRRELRRHGVKVAIVEPGPITTPIWDKARHEGAIKIESYPDEIKNAYGRSIERFYERLEMTIRSAASVDVVVKAIDHALTSPHPKTRYPVGKGIKLSAFLTQLLPDRILDRLV